MSAALERTLGAYERVVEALEAGGFGPIRSGKARCPSHDDHTPSLHITRGARGVLVKCFVGCTAQEIVAALDMKPADLFDSPALPVTTEPKSKIAATYDYADEQGNLLFQVVRFDPKDFRQRRPEDAGGWNWSVRGVRLVPYHLDELVAAVAADDPVYICEGERDADRVRGLGLAATCNPMGAGKWRPEYSEYLKGARDVRVVADRDEPGYRHASDIATSLRAVSANVAVLEAAVGKDATDHLDAGLGIDELVAIDPTERIASATSPPTTSDASSFSALHENAYRMTVPSAATVFELDFLRRDGGQLKGELLVRCDLAGARTFDGVLSIGDLNLSSARARESHAKYLAERARAKDVDWIGMLEELAQRTLAAERAGSPAVVLGDMPRTEAESALEAGGLALLARHPNLIFGDGGTAKSYIALHAAGVLAKRGMRVGYFDWELAGEDHRDRLERLFGDALPAIHYVRCIRPLYYEADRLRRIIREHEITFAVFDSIAFAADGPPEAAEVAARYFQALRQLGEIGSLHVAHITKAAEGADKRPFGSAFWHNGARSTWNVKLAEGNPGDARISVGLYHRKANLGPLRPAVGLELSFESDRTVVRSVDLAFVPDLSASLPLRQRMIGALRSGAMPFGELAGELNASKDTLQRTARRYPKMFRVLDGGLVGLAQ